MTRRRWIADRWDATSATLLGDQAAHLARVLRGQPGMAYDVVAGGKVFSAVITESNESSVFFELIGEIEAASPPAITVLLSIFKFDRLEWAIEKLVELGVATIEPAMVRRTEKHLAQAAANRVERWRRIALEAAKQSRRASLPELSDPQPLKQALDKLASVPGQPLRLLLAENEKHITLLAALRAARGTADEAADEPGLTPAVQPEVLLAVGPEGGWAPEEEALFTEHGWVAVSLGSTILRAETAAIAAVAITAAHLQG